MKQLMAKGMLKSFEDFGVKLVKFSDNDTIYIQAPLNPRFSHAGELEKFKGGHGLSKRIQKMLDEICGGQRKVTVKYKII